MKRFIPFPFLTLFLFSMWILLTGFSPGHILLGGGIAIITSRTMLSLQPDPPNIRFSVAIPKLLWVMFCDIIQSNWVTIKIILFGKKNRQAGFIYLPVKIRSPYALAAFSMICTATPGTLWVQYDAGSGVILIHLLDLAEEESFIEKYSAEYEPLLLEIFE
ncbi:MAG TPA: Na+/H+ antiporter subunit E [Sphingopyxis sp.]|nr:Na+/H+ antiporter subunit E [Sphingopyxis sp.]